jgi:hypothetical protein
VAGSCVYGDEPSGSIKCGEFLLASQEGLCSMELVVFRYHGVSQLVTSESIGLRGVGRGTVLYLLLQRGSPEYR